MIRRRHRVPETNRCLFTRCIAKEAIPESPRRRVQLAPKFQREMPFFWRISLRNSFEGRVRPAFTSSRPCWIGVDGLLAQHPDFPKWTMNVPAANKGKAAFVKASAWPDDIKSDPRFFDPGEAPTPEISGLPPGSNKRNRDWHFTNVPFTMDDTPLKPPAATNALAKLQDFESLGSFPTQKQVYVLPWLIHIAGDVHQPLHTLA